MTAQKLTQVVRPLSAVIDIPGSKSVTNRALIIGALSKDAIVIKNPLFCDDTLSMIKCLKDLGIKVVTSKKHITVVGSVQDVKKQDYTLNAGLSGTTFRFLLPLLCITPGNKILMGEKGLSRRPIRELVRALQSIGAQITYLKEEGFAPIRIGESPLLGDTIRIQGGVSSQYLSALLMVLPLMDSVTITVSGDLVSKPYPDLTIQMMKDFGVEVITKNNKEFQVKKNQTYHIDHPYVVEGDLSSACYFAALAVLTKSKIELKNINPKSTQGDLLFLNILRGMGNRVTEKENSVIITGKKIMPITINMEECPDQIQTLAVLAAFAKGKTVVSGIQTLSFKETDRVVAVRNELKKMGIRTEVNKHTLTIYGGTPQGVAIDTYGDHRMAMSFAVAGTRLSGLSIKNPEVVSKTFPDFWSKMRKIGV